MTYNEVIYSIREGVRQYSDDSSLSNRLILFLVNLERASYLKFYSDKGRLPETNKQTICLQFEEVINSECGCENESCTILKSTKKVPKLVNDAKFTIGAKDAIASNFVSWNRFTHSGFNKYNTNLVFASVNADQFLYIKSPNELHKFITCGYLTGIFESPDDASEFTDLNGSSCYNAETDEYPLDMDGFNKIRQVVISKLAQSLGIPEDTINNAADDIQGKTK